MNVQAKPRPRTVDPEGKRTAILHAAQELFASHGFEKTVIADIAANAEVAVGSVHRIFGDKNRLLLAAQADIEDQFIEAMTAGWYQSGTLGARFRLMLKSLFSEMVRLKTLMPLMKLHAENGGTLDVERKTMHSAIAAIMQEAIDIGDFRSVPVKIAASITHGMVEAAMSSAFSSGSLEDIDQHIEVLADAMERFLTKRFAF